MGIIMCFETSLKFCKRWDLNVKHIIKNTEITAYGLENVTRSFIQLLHLEYKNQDA
jgi:hypothetical protein